MPGALSQACLGISLSNVLRPTSICLVCHTVPNFRHWRSQSWWYFALNVRQVADHVVRVLSRTELRDLGTVVTNFWYVFDDTSR
jgi:hypothetical protein